MLDQMRLKGPNCLKCKTPTRFYSLEHVEDKTVSEMMAVFQCDKCGMLAAETAADAAA